MANTTLPVVISGFYLSIIYTADGHLLPCVDTVADLVVFSNHCNVVCAKANAWHNLILCSFRGKCVDILVKAFITYDRPVVEYASYVWSSRLVWDKVMVERVQNVSPNVSLAFAIINMQKGYTFWDLRKQDVSSQT